MFRTDLISIVGSPYTVFTAIGIFHNASCFSPYFVSHFCCVGFIQFSFGDLILLYLFPCWALTNLKNTNCCEYSIKTPDVGK